MASGAAGNGRKLSRHIFFGASRRLESKSAAPAPASPAADIPRGDPQDPGGFDPVEPGLDWQPPEGMAQLYVMREAIGGDQYCLLATSWRTPVKKLDVFGGPDLDLAKLLGEKGRAGKRSPRETLEVMKEWSRAKVKLTRWLDDLRAGHDELELVVWDKTTLHVPWEIFWLLADPTSPRRADWLGAVMTVTRWAEIRTAWPERSLKSFMNPGEGNGAIAAYVAEEMDRDRLLLDDGFTVRYSDDMRQLLERLNATDGELALVYVACHGTFGDRPERCTLDGFSARDAASLSDNGLARLREQSALVFLNACHSGVTGIDMVRYNDGALRGFAEVFLRAGASGVLATTGAVGKDLAHKLAGGVLDHLRGNNGASVPRELQAQRAGAAARMNELLDAFTRLPATEQTAANRELLEHIFLFMYVYYGSPRLRLSLAPGATGEYAGTGG
jgi:hypothetical protein